MTITAHFVVGASVLIATAAGNEWIADRERAARVPATTNTATVWANPQARALWARAEWLTTLVGGLLFAALIGLFALLASTKYSADVSGLVPGLSSVVEPISLPPGSLFGVSLLGVVVAALIVAIASHHLKNRAKWLLPSHSPIGEPAQRKVLMRLARGGFEMLLLAVIGILLSPTIGGLLIFLFVTVIAVCSAADLLVQIGFALARHGSVARVLSGLFAAAGWGAVAVVLAQAGQWGHRLSSLGSAAMMAYVVLLYAVVINFAVFVVRLLFEFRRPRTDGANPVAVGS